MALLHDPDVFRGFLEIQSCLTPPDEVFGRSGFTDRVFAAAAGRVVRPLPGPDRAQVLRLVA